jgi:hypothetical protein
MVLIGLGWTGCSAADECTAEDTRCAGSVLQECLADPIGAGGDWNPHDRGPNSWVQVADCGAPDLCVTSSSAGASDGAVQHDAFCVLAPTADPLCSPNATSVCEGATVATDCDQGFAVARHLCASCQDGLCAGGLEADCTTSSDCGAGLVCRASDQACEMPCTCSEGAVCDSCRAAEDDAPGANGVYKMLCIGGFCFPD